jgi:hypothetical protein
MNSVFPSKSSLEMFSLFEVAEIPSTYLIYHLFFKKGCPGWGTNPGSFGFGYSLIPFITLPLSHSGSLKWILTGIWNALGIFRNICALRRDHASQEITLRAILNFSPGPPGANFTPRGELGPHG